MSALRCWPGCLATVVESTDPRNLGIVVEVLRPAPPVDSGFAWWVRATRPVPTINHGTGQRDTRLEARCADNRLRPITTPPDADTTPAVQPVEETA